MLEIEDPSYDGLLHHRLLRVEGRDVVTKVSGPQIPGGDSGVLPTTDNPGILTLEWSNSLAFAMRHQGEFVKCHFTLEEAQKPQLPPEHPSEMLEVMLKVRPMFDGDSAAPAAGLLQPGELTQGLCSPWQHDYRECSCYYWPASRPDYVNVRAGPLGISQGDNWLAKGTPRPGAYILDDRKDGRLVTYDELFQNWEAMLQFQVRGQDAEESE